MAAKLVSAMAEFDVGADDWVEYSERFDMYLLANGVTGDDVKRAVFLSTIGGAAYKLLRSLVGEEVKTKSLADLQKAMKDHLKPTPNVIAERFRFFKRDRAAGETVNQYITELQRLSEHCEFRAELKTYLRDRFVCGLNSQTVQQKLLASKDLDLAKALDLARSYESSSRDAKLIHAEAGVSHVHQVEMNERDCVHKIGLPQGSKIESRECYRCGNGGHLAAKCPYASYACHRCGMKGHLKKRCRQEGKSSVGASTHKSAPVRKLCTCAEGEVLDHGGTYVASEALSLDPLNLFLLQRKNSEPVMVEVLLNGRLVRMEVDTGAAVTVMNRPSFARVKKNEQKLQRSDVKLQTYTGEIIAPEGVGDVMVEYHGQKANLPITVVDGNMPNLMGRDWLTQLKLKWEELFPLRAPVHKLERAPSPVDSLLSEFPDVFTDELGCLRDFKVHIPVPENVVPKYCKARPVPYALRDRLDAELEELEKQGVWRRVEYSRWAAPVVTVLKDSRDPMGPIRICGDYKQTVNKAAPLDGYPIPNTVDQLAMLAGGDKFTKLDLSQAYQQLELDEASKELLTISTHQGLFQPARLQFGIHSATGIFQREMDRRLLRIPFTKARVDDKIS